MMIRAVYSFIIFSLFVVSLAKAQIHASKLKNLGPQITAAVIQGSLFLEDPSGTEMVYTVVRGNPAHLLGYRLSDQKLITDQQLPGTDGAWDLAVSSDGWLYIPGAKGRLYRHLPGTQQVEDLGTVLPGETTIWNLAAGKDGEMFGATYPGCRVFRYHPGDGFSDVGRGPLVEGENYVRSLAYYPATGKLFAGIGSHADLIELDPANGSKRSILPAQFKNKEFVYSLEILEDLPGGDRLLALITNGSFTLVFNLKTGNFEYEIKEMDMKAISQPDIEKHFYYTLKSGLYSREAHLPEKEPVKYAADIGSANAIRLINNKLYILNSAAELIVMDMDNKRIKRHKFSVPGQPIALQSIMKGPDSRIWSGGYLAGGHAAYDPETGRTTSYPGLHQTEGMTVRGRYIYFGIYPKGLYYEYDSSLPWNIENSNPKFLGQIPGQSRSFAVLNEEVSGKVYFGMVPEYGQLGGHLVSYNTHTGELKTYGTVVKDQSIVSLIYANNRIWGGTSVSGGLGIRPSTSDAKLFSWDTKEHKILDDIIPVPGAKAITSMITGPDGNVWGMAGGTLFIFDPVQKRVLRTKVLYPTPPLVSHVWRDAFLVLHPSGMIYGTGNNQLFSIDPRTMEFQSLLKPASLLAMDDKGRIYFHRSAELWQFDPGRQ
jgi:hypothetical protein